MGIDRNMLLRMDFGEWVCENGFVRMRWGNGLGKWIGRNVIMEKFVALSLWPCFYLIAIVLGEHHLSGFIDIVIVVWDPIQCTRV